MARPERLWREACDAHEPMPPRRRARSSTRPIPSAQVASRPCARSARAANAVSVNVAPFPFAARACDRAACRRRRRPSRAASRAGRRRRALSPAARAPTTPRRDSGVHREAAKAHRGPSRFTPRAAARWSAVRGRGRAGAMLGADAAGRRGVAVPRRRRRTPRSARGPTRASGGFDEHGCARAATIRPGSATQHGRRDLARRVPRRRRGHQLVMPRRAVARPCARRATLHPEVRSARHGGTEDGEPRCSAPQNGDRRLQRRRHNGDGDDAGN